MPEVPITGNAADDLSWMTREWIVSAVAKVAGVGGAEADTC